MPRIEYPERLDTLIALAEGQDGYFTTEQAREAGIALPGLISLERSSHVERTRYGVYRLARWPSREHSSLWPVFLWARRLHPETVFSHRTALELHGVSAINPAKIDVTFPPGARIQSTKPPAVVTHRRDLPRTDVETWNDLPVTTLYRTLLDLATDGIARSALADLLDRDNVPGLTSEQLQQVRAVYALSDKTRQFLARAMVRTGRVQWKPHE